MLDPESPNVSSITLHLTNMHMYTARVSTEPGGSEDTYLPSPWSQWPLVCSACHQPGPQPGPQPSFGQTARLGSAEQSGHGLPEQQHAQQRSCSWKTIHKQSKARLLTKPLKCVPRQGCGELPSSWDALGTANVARPLFCPKKSSKRVSYYTP